MKDNIFQGHDRKKSGHFPQYFLMFVKKSGEYSKFAGWLSASHCCAHTAFVWTVSARNAWFYNAWNTQRDVRLKKIFRSLFLKTYSLLHCAYSVIQPAGSRIYEFSSARQKHDVWITAVLESCSTAEAVEINCFPESNLKVWFRRRDPAKLDSRIWFGTTEARRLNHASLSCSQRGKNRAQKMPLVLVFLLVGWKTGARFLGQSRSVVIAIFKFIIGQFSNDCRK